MIPRDVALPENCRVRLVDLPLRAGGAIAVDADGFINIYLNVRLSRREQRMALLHELEHHYRGDLYSDRDIRSVEREAEPLMTVDGTPIRRATPPFDAPGLRRVGQGLYLPSGENLTRATAHVLHVRALLMEACRVYDVMQTPPLLPVDALAALASKLGPGDIAFAAWQMLGGRCVPMLHFSREDLWGAVYYDAVGAPDNALIAMECGDTRLNVDLRRRNRRLMLHGILRERDGGIERVY